MLRKRTRAGGMRQGLSRMLKACCCVEHSLTGVCPVSTSMRRGPPSDRLTAVQRVPCAHPAPPTRSAASKPIIPLTGQLVPCRQGLGSSAAPLDGAPSLAPRSSQRCSRQRTTSNTADRRTITTSQDPLGGAGALGSRRSLPRPGCSLAWRPPCSSSTRLAWDAPGSAPACEALSSDPAGGGRR